MKRARTRPAPKAPTDIILQSISDGVFTVDRNWRVTSFNRAAEQITGIPAMEAVGRPCCDVFRASMCENECALRRTIETGTPIVNRSAFIVDAAGRRIPISVSTALLRDAGGRIIGGVETFRDLSLVEELRRELHGRFEIGDLVSRSRSMRRILEVLPRVAASDSTVLILGETGTGKELLARAIHGLSPRQDKPFVAVNCGALPDEWVGRTPTLPATGSGITAAVRALEAQAIGAALERHHGNRLAAARELGLHKSTLFRKLKALAIELPEQDGRMRTPVRVAQ